MDTTDGPAAGVRARLTDTLRAYSVVAAAVAVPVAAAASSSTLLAVAHGKWPPVSTPIDCAAQRPPLPSPRRQQWRQQPHRQICSRWTGRRLYGRVDRDE